MNFDFSDEQKMLATEVRRLLGERASANHLRTLADQQAGWDWDLWRKAGEMGLLGAAIPEIFGGSGLDEIDLCVICEEMGRAPAPLPFANTVGTVAEAIRHYGSDSQKSKYLPGIVSGEMIGTYAWLEDAGDEEPMRATVRSGLLTGRKSPVADTQIADFAVVAAVEAGAPGLFLVSLDCPEVTSEALDGFDMLRRYATLRFADVAADRLPGSSASALQALENGTAIYTAFEQIGGAEACLLMARDYAVARKTFGRSVASYQAIKHKLADLLVEIELARSNAYYAAWALAARAPDLAEATAVARLSATSAYDQASRENLHVHGGFGYTWEADCHFHYRRARLLAACPGAPGVWAVRLLSAMQARAAPHLS